MIPFLLLTLACTSNGKDTTDTGETTSPDGGTADGGTTDGLVGLSALSAELDPTIGSLVRVSWTQAGSGPVALEYQLDGAWVAAPVQTREAGPQELLIPGIPFDHDTAIRVTADGVLSEELALRTAELPPSIPELSLLTTDPTSYDPSVAYLLLSLNQTGTHYNGPWWTLIVDRQGRVVWALETPDSYSTLWAQPARDGRSLLIDHNSFWTLFDRAATSRIMRIGFDGSELEQFDTPGMGHAFVELPDGRIAWPGNVEGDERLFTIDAKGQTEELWDCGKFMGDLGALEACGANSITYDEASDSVILSFFSSETVLQFDLARGEPSRWFGHVSSDWTFADPDTTFWWQHGAILTAEGTLLLSTRRSETAEETVLREYTLNESTLQLEEIWSFGAGEDLYAPTLGEGHRLAGGNTIQNLGSYARIREVTPSGTVVWDLDLGGARQFVGRSVPMSSLWELAGG